VPRPSRADTARPARPTCRRSWMRSCPTIYECGATSLRSIAGEMNARGILTRRGGRSTCLNRHKHPKAVGSPISRRRISFATKSAGQPIRSEADLERRKAAIS
jgi:hypothetical protein